MKKCDLFPVLDNQSKQLKQLVGLSNLMFSASGSSNTSPSDLCACLSIVSDLANESLNANITASESLIQLTSGNNCVSGLG
jgi:hypothetical protein